MFPLKGSIAIGKTNVVVLCYKSYYQTLPVIEDLDLADLMNLLYRNNYCWALLDNLGGLLLSQNSL